jgi:hypothetical protein
MLANFFIVRLGAHPSTSGVARPFQTAALRAERSPFFAIVLRPLERLKKSKKRFSELFLKVRFGSVKP